MKILVLIILVPSVFAVGFDEPASIYGTFSSENSGRMFLQLPEGSASIDGSFVSILHERTIPLTGNGNVGGPTREIEREHFLGLFEGASFSSATLEVKGSWTISGATSAEIWGTTDTCNPSYQRLSSPICHQIGSPWAHMTIENPQIAIVASQSNWTDMNWQRDIPDSKYEREITDVGIYYAGYSIVRTNEIQGAHEIVITAPSVEMYIGMSSFGIDGSIELPNYNDESSSAPNLVAEGSFQFRNMTFKDGRFEADMSGEAEAARLDNEIVSSESLGLAAVSVAGSAAISILIWKTLSGTLVAGFTRMSMEDALEHPKRQKVYGYILGNPGATFREVVRETGYATGTTRHHLTILKRSNAIMEQKYLQTLRYYENHGRYNETWDTIALLREEPLALLHQWVMDNPLNNQKAILAAMAQVGWSRSTAQHRLSRLVDGGLVSMRPQGRMNLYEASSTVMR